MAKNIFGSLFTGKTNITIQSFKKWNIVLFVLFLAQGLAVLIFSSIHNFSVDMPFLTTDTLQTKLTGRTVMAPATRQLFTVNLSYLIAAFLFMAALAHLLGATIYRQRYEAGLKKGVNYFRWIEYAFSASLMLVVIGLLAGVNDFTGLLLIFIAMAVASLLGLIMELYSPLAKRSAKSGCAVSIVAAINGLVPWVVIGLYMLATNVFGDGHVPTYLYLTYGLVLLVFVAFAFNIYLQFAKRGKWANYLYGERWFMILSFISKALLAWLVFAGLLHP